MDRKLKLKIVGHLLDHIRKTKFFGYINLYTKLELISFYYVGEESTPRPIEEYLEHRLFKIDQCKREMSFHSNNIWTVTDVDFNYFQTEMERLISIGEMLILFLSEADKDGSVQSVAQYYFDMVERRR